MGKITVTLSEEMGAEIERICSRLGISVDELVRRAVADYLRRLEGDRGLEPTGFGMWADRSDMEDSAQWVRGLRERGRKGSW